MLNFRVFDSDSVDKILLFQHETSSCDITRYIFEKNDIKLSTDMQEHGNGIEIIVAMIIGDVDCLTKYLSKDQMYLSEVCECFMKT